MNSRILSIGFIGVVYILGCASLPQPPELPPQTAQPPGTTTYMDKSFATLEAEHPGQSGFLMLDEGRKAFAARVQSVRLAERSLDIQTYIWHGDLTGLHLAYEILQAADRGVKVRLLLDDLDSRAKHDPLVALDQHENIEVRLFNPMASRYGSLAAMVDFFRAFRRLNHRMHIKNWIADNRVVIAGGRNVGDEYFTASDDTNFADFELLMMGPVVRDSSAAFDRFWNASTVYPIASLQGERAPGLALSVVREALAQSAQATLKSDYARALQEDDAVLRLASGKEQVYWLEQYQLVADSPNKMDAEGVLEKSAVLSLLLPVLQQAKQDVVIVSPYFVPGKEGTALLLELAQRGVNVRLLTNSLAANDVAAVHGGYARYREALVKGGVRIWELKPDAGVRVKKSLFGSSGASLHAKALTVDGQRLFVGSYNLDPRSTALNAEMGTLVSSPDMAMRFNQQLEAHSDTSSAWEVIWEDGQLQWKDNQGIQSREPAASLWRRFQAWVAGMLPVDPLL